jgi:hypothetical protein
MLLIDLIFVITVKGYYFVYTWRHFVQGVVTPLAVVTSA